MLYVLKIILVYYDSPYKYDNNIHKSQWDDNDEDDDKPHKSLTMHKSTICVIPNQINQSVIFLFTLSLRY